MARDMNECKLHAEVNKHKFFQVAVVSIVCIVVVDDECVLLNQHDMKWIDSL